MFKLIFSIGTFFILFLVQVGCASQESDVEDFVILMIFEVLRFFKF